MMSNPYERAGNSNSSSRNLDYGLFSLSSSVTVSGSSTFVPVDTSEDLVGDISIGSNGISLIAGRTYDLTYYPYINNMSGVNLTLQFYNYTDSEAIGQIVTVVDVNNTGDIATSNVMELRYTPSTDCVICLQNTSARTGNVYPGANYLFVKEAITTVSDS